MREAFSSPTAKAPVHLVAGVAQVRFGTRAITGATTTTTGLRHLTTSEHGQWYNEPMFEPAAHDPPTQTYVTVGQLAKILGRGWGSRPNVYYWLRKCKIKVIDIAGHPMLPAEDIPKVVMILTKAKEDARARRTNG